MGFVLLFFDQKLLKRNSSLLRGGKIFSFLTNLLCIMQFICGLCKNVINLTISVMSVYCLFYRGIFD